MFFVNTCNIIIGWKEQEFDRWKRKFEHRRTEFVVRKYNKAVVEKSRLLFRSEDVNTVVILVDILQTYVISSNTLMLVGS